MRNYLIIYLLLFSFIHSISFCDELELNILVSPEEISIGEGANISLEVNKKVDKVIPPEDKDFKITYLGLSQQSYVSIVNGKMTSKQSYVYQFLFTSSKVGEVVIPSFTVIYKSKTYKTPEKIIKIVKRKRASQAPKSPFEELEELLSPPQALPVIMLVLEANKKKAYQNEGVIVDLYLVTDRKEAFDYTYQEVSPIRTDKAVFYDISQSLPQDKITRSGKYYKKLIKKYIFFPTEKGVLGIAPPDVVALTPYGQIRVKSYNIGIDVADTGREGGLPYIGELSLEYSISTNIVKLGETINLKLIFSGSGNLKVFYNIYKDIKVEGLFFSPHNSSINFLGLKNGTPYFKEETEISIIPQKTGKFTIPSIKIDYYDSKMKKKEIFLPSFEINVIEETPAVKEYNGLEFREIKSHPYHFILQNPIALIYISLILLMPLLAFIYRQFQNRLASDEKFKKKFLAGKKLKHYLKLAQESIGKNNYKDFYSYLQKAILYFIYDRFDISSSVTFKELAIILREKGINEGIIKELQEIYWKCQFVYSGKVSRENATEILNQVKKLLEKI